MLERLITDFWGLVGTFVVGVLYSFVHRSVAVSGAKKIATTLMLAAEKRAEELILVTGQDKFNWVVDKGYDLLPASLRMFISKPMFRTIVQDLLDESIQTAKRYFVGSPISKPQASPAESWQSSGNNNNWSPTNGAIPLPPATSLRMPPVKPIPPMTASAMPPVKPIPSKNVNTGSNPDSEGDGAPV